VTRTIENMPAGTIGLEAVGKVSDDDYRDVLVPAVSRALERNDVRLMWSPNGLRPPRGCGEAAGAWMRRDVTGQRRT
jgi:hypothetical protein